MWENERGEVELSSEEIDQIVDRIVEDLKKLGRQYGVSAKKLFQYTAEAFGGPRVPGIDHIRELVQEEQRLGGQNPRDSMRIRRF